MDTNRLKRFATEARNILMQGVAHRFTSLGFLPDGTVTEEPQPMGGGATFMGDTVSEDFYQKWRSLQRAVNNHSIEEVAEEAAYTWFNRLVAIRIMVKNGLIAPVLQYEGDGVHIPLLVSEARQGRMPDMNADDQRKLNDLLADDSQTAEQFRILIVAFCHANPVINSCFGHISDYTELLLPTNILSEGGFVDMLNNTEFISEEDYHSPELIGWLYQFYISEKKDDVFASFKKGKKAEAKDIPAATQIFTPNWIVKYMVQNTIGRIYLDNNPYEEDIQKNWKYLVEPSEPTPKDSILHYDDLKELKFGDLACGSGHILNEGFDILYDLYILEGYSRKDAVENIFRYNLTGIDIDTRAKQLAQFALLLKACQKDSSFADAHIMPKVLDMPEPYPAKDNLRDTLPHFFIGGNQQMVQEVCDAIDLMDEAKNLGSIMKFNISESTRNAIAVRMEEYESQDIVPGAIRQLMPYMQIILALTEKYSALVMNPPYMSRIGMNGQLCAYVQENYSDSKWDLFAVFMHVGIDRLLHKGKLGTLNIQSWMFLSSFSDLRNSFLNFSHIDSLLHLGAHTFDELSGEVVQNTAFVVTNGTSCSNAIFYRLVDGGNCRDKETMFLNGEYRYESIGLSDFSKIPGAPIGYWLNDAWLSLFNNKYLKTFCTPKAGVVTGKDNYFLRFWFEVTCSDIVPSSPVSDEYGKYHLFQKGGTNIEYYGNGDYVIKLNDLWNENYYNPSIRRGDKDAYFKKGIGWSYISGTQTKFRYVDNSVCGTQTPTIYVNNDKYFYYVLGLLNTKLSNYLLSLYNPTISLGASDICNVPFIASDKAHHEEISKRVKNSVEISRQDWDARESSWDFQRNELLTMDEQTLFDNIDYIIEKHYKETGEHICIEPAAPRPESVEWCYDTYCTKWERLFMQLHSNEEELNRQFIEIYGLQDELTPDVPLDEITILQQGEISIENE